MPEVPNWRADLNTTQGPDRYVQHESITQFHRPAFSGTASAESENWGAVNRLGNALRIAGERGLSIAGDINDRFNQGVCQQKIAEYEVARAAKQRELSQRKGINALENGTGEDVAGVYTEASGWHAMKAHDLMENCNAAQRRYLTQYLDRAGGNFKAWAGNYQDQQQQVYEKNSFDAATTALVNAGIADPANLPEYLGSLRGVIGDRARDQGWSVEQAETLFAASQRKAVTTAVTNALAAGDVMGAMDLYSRYTGVLTDQEKQQLQDMTVAQAAAQANTMAATGNYNGALAAVQTAKDFKGYGAPTLPQPKGESASRWNLRHNNWGNLTTGQYTKGGRPIYQAFPDAKQGAFGMFHQWDLYHTDPARKVDTLAQLIYVWSPPTENKTENIIKYLEKHTGIKRDQKLDFNDPGQLGKILYWQAQIEHEAKSKHLIPSLEQCTGFAKAYIDEGRPQPQQGVPAALLAQAGQATGQLSGTQVGAQLWAQFGEVGQAEKGLVAIQNIEDPAARAEASREFQAAAKLSRQEHAIKGQAAGVALWDQHQYAAFSEVQKITNPIEREAAEKTVMAKRAEADRAHAMAVEADLAQGQAVVEQFLAGKVPIDAVLALAPKYPENTRAFTDLTQNALERGMGIPAVSNPMALIQAQDDMAKGMTPVELRQKYTTELSKKDLDAIIKKTTDENEKYLAKVKNGIFDEYFLGSKLYKSVEGDATQRKQVYTAWHLKYLKKAHDENITTEEGLRRAVIELCMEYRIPTTTIFGTTGIENGTYEDAQAARRMGAHPAMVVPDRVRDAVEARWKSMNPGKDLPKFSDAEIISQALIDDPTLMRFFR